MVFYGGFTGAEVDGGVLELDLGERASSHSLLASATYTCTALCQSMCLQADTVFMGAKKKLGVFSPHMVPLNPLISVPSPCCEPSPSLRSPSDPTLTPL